LKPEVGGVTLGHGRIHGCLRIGAIEGVSGTVNHESGGLEVRRHVGNLELKGLEIGDVPAKGLALVHVIASLVERRPSCPQRAGADVDAAAVEAAHGVLEAVAFDASYESSEERRVGTERRSR